MGSRTGDPADTLSAVVGLIQQHFQTDVCSIYLIKPDRANLVLAATVGLRPESVGRVSMRLNEGLAGLAAEQLRPIVVDDAPRHPRFKYFAEAGEEPYHSFLGVPLMDQGVMQGVLVVQTREPRSFSREETAMMVDGRQSAGADRQRGPHARAVRRPGVRTNLGAGAKPVVELGPGRRVAVPRARPGALARAGPQPRSRCSSEISIDQLEERARRHVLHSRMNYAYRRMQEYLKSDDTWGAGHAGVLWARPVAYFSAEFGLHESLPIYSGGLGILAGDHIKSA